MVWFACCIEFITANRSTRFICDSVAKRVQSWSWLCGCRKESYLENGRGHPSEHVHVTSHCFLYRYTPGLTNSTSPRSLRVCSCCLILALMLWFVGWI